MKGARYVLAGAAILAAAVFFVQTRESSCDAQAVFFSEMLAEATLRQEIHLDAVYVVNSGHVEDEGLPACKRASVVRLAYAAALAERAPLFALPGTDLDLFDITIEKLNGRITTYDTFQGSREAYGALRALYPLQLLTSMRTTEELRRAFVTHPSPETLARYSASQRTTLTAYLRDIHRHTRAFEEFVPPTHAAYITGGTELTRSAIATALHELRAQAFTTGQLLLRRISCIRGHIGSCDPIRLTLPDVLPPSSDESRPYTDLREHIADIRNTTIDPSFPTILLSSSTCVEYLGARPSFTLRPTADASDTLLTRPIFTGDILFLDTTHDNTSFYRSFADANVRYVFSNPLISYMCPNLAGDAGQFYATRAARTRAQHAPISEHAGERRAYLQQLEKRLSGTFIREDDARRYRAEIRTLLEEDVFDRATTIELTDLLLAAEYGSAGFEHTVFLATAMQDHTAVAPDTTYLQIPYLFFARSGFLTLFLGSNPSVIGRPFDPFPRATPEEMEASPYVLYSSLSPEERATAARDLAAYYRAHGITP